ncbi:MAG: hypothetical protein KR126chlam1_00009 [Chlamydiae bacterium]|nr:hypothetical protein [Chlamydiota bacterium]
MKKKLLISLICFPLALHLFQLFFLHFDGALHPRSFEHGFQKSYTTEVQGLDPSLLDPILSQSFHYLGNGKQMIALESADEKYVLKLFNPMRPLKKGWPRQIKYWKRYSSAKWISREWSQKKNRLKKLFTRHKLAFETLRSETGLLYVHLAPHSRINHFVRATDQKGKMQMLSLANTPFVLQEKATLVPQYLRKLIQENRLEEAKTAVLRLQNLFEKRIAVGITDRIQTMENNYGFVDGKPIQIDVGRIRFDPLLNRQAAQEMNRILTPLQDWLHNNFPEML